MVGKVEGVIIYEDYISNKFKTKSNKNFPFNDNINNDSSSQQEEGYRKEITTKFTRKIDVPNVTDKRKGSNSSNTSNSKRQRNCIL